MEPRPGNVKKKKNVFKVREKKSLFFLSSPLPNPLPLCFKAKPDRT